MKEKYCLKCIIANGKKRNLSIQDMAKEYEDWTRIKLVHHIGICSKCWNNPDVLYIYINNIESIEFNF